LRIWMPAIHAGMTRSVFSSSAGERKLMEHFFKNWVEAALVVDL
jgi:hypothetical protein